MLVWVYVNEIHYIRISSYRENAPNWDEDIKNDVVDECRNHGGALHVYVDKNSAEGNVYVKCPNLTVAAASVTALHGRYFAGILFSHTLKFLHAHKWNILGYSLNWSYCRRYISHI